MLETAKKFLLSTGKFHVIGGYLRPTGDAKLSQQSQTNPSKGLKTTEWNIPWQHRVQMCKIMIKSNSDQQTNSNWIMVNEWSAASNSPVVEMKAHLINSLRLELGEEVVSKIRFLGICGADALPKLKSKNSLKNGVVCVLNRKVDFDFFKFLESHPFKNSIMVAVEEDWKLKDFSSTKLRTNLSKGLPIDNLTHPLVTDYIVKHKKNYSWTTVE